jgi:hypothetical protein
MNLARPFKAGKKPKGIRRRVATTKEKASIVARRREPTTNRNPALKRRAKLISTLRVENADFRTML